MAIIFRYVHIPRPDGTLRAAPFIPLTLRDSSDKQLRVIALLDSGADETVIPKDLAEVLGLKEQGDETDTGGIGGKVKVKKTRLSLRIGVGQRECYNLSIPALILQDKNQDVPLLLGRHGFFEHFHITFKQDEEKIVLTKINPRKVY